MDRTVVDIVNKTVPISLFNKGKAGQVFEDVKENGAKVVLKNNEPEAVIISPKEYAELVEDIEDFSLALMAEERLKKHPEPDDRISQDDFLKKIGVTQQELDEMEDVEIE